MTKPSMLALSILATALLATPSTMALAQATAINPIANACGSQPANYVVTHDHAPLTQAPALAGKALVYIIERMTNYPIITKKVNIGLDGTWLGATDAQSYISLTMDPGVHHLCAVYQGKAAGMDQEGHTLLLHLNAEAGKTYYLRYHAFFSKDSPGIAFFEAVDEDEGQLLLQQSEHATSALKK